MCLYFYCIWLEKIWFDCDFIFRRSSMQDSVTMKDITNDMIPRAHQPPPSQYIPGSQATRHVSCLLVIKQTF